MNNSKRVDFTLVLNYTTKCSQFNFEIVKYLVDQGSDVHQLFPFEEEEDEEEPNIHMNFINHCVLKGYLPQLLEIIPDLDLSIACCFSDDVPPSNPIHSAIYCLESLLFMIKMGVDVNQQNSYGNTLLHLVFLHSDYAKDEGLHTFRKHYEQLLLNGAKLFIKNDDGETPLDFLLDQPKGKDKKKALDFISRLHWSFNTFILNYKKDLNTDIQFKLNPSTSTSTSTLTSASSSSATELNCGKEEQQQEKKDGKEEEALPVDFIIKGNRSMIYKHSDVFKSMFQG